MTPPPETSVIAWGNTQLPYTIQRSARRRKTVAVSVDAVRGVLVAAPSDISTPEIEAVVRRKAAWIGVKLRGLESQHALPGQREFVSGESVLYLGRHYRLRVCPLGNGPAKLRGRWLHVPADAGEGRADQVRTALSAWLRLRAEERLPERVAAWRAKVGVPMPPLLVASQRKRWGSCDSRGTIRLNWRIVQAPMRLVDYVIVHELAHLRHRGHGRDYWRAVGRVMPDYDRRRKELRELGGRLIW